MTTETGGTAPAGTSPKSPKRVFYRQLAQVLSEGGFDRHMGALCKPFIANAMGPAWWSSQPSSYFRLLFVGYFEGIESEQELCWLIEDSQAFREFIGFDSDHAAPDPATLAQVRQPLMPLIHSEAFDTLMRIIDKSGLLEGRQPGLDIAALLSDPAVAATVSRIRSKDHHNYWKRLTKTGGASWSTRPSAPPKANRPQSPFATSAPATESEPFALWIEDLSLAQAEFNDLRAAGVTDFGAHFAEGASPAIDHVIRACIYGRGPNSVSAFASAATQKRERDLPQQMTAESLEACRTIAVALAEGKREVAVEAPLLDADGLPAIAAIHLVVAPGFEDSLQTVLVSFADITLRKQQQLAPRPADSHLDRALALNHVGVWEWDVTNDTTYWSDAMLSIYGISREEFSGKHSDYLEYTYPEDREAQRDSVRQSTADAASRTHATHRPAVSTTSFKDYRIRRQDGQIRWVRGGAVEIVDDQGRPNRMQGVLWDVTESKQLELQLRESEEHYRHMVDDAPIPVVASAFDGEIIFANDCALSALEVSRDDLPKLRAVDLWEDPAQRVDATSILAEKGELRGYLARFRIDPAQEPRVSLMNANVVEYAGRNVILSYHQDFTERERTAGQILSIQQHATNLMEQQHRNLALMNRILSARDEDTGVMLDTTCRALVETLGLQTAIALLFTEGGAKLVVAAQGSGSQEPTRLGTRLPFEESSLRALFDGSPGQLCISDISVDDRAIGFRDLLASTPYTSVMLSPLVNDGVWMGVLLLDTGVGRVLPEEERQLAWTITGHVGRALFSSRADELRQRGHMERSSRLLRSEKLDAIAGTATGIARALNNALGSVLGFGELALENVMDNPAARDYLLELVKGAEHTQNILDQIASVGRRGQPEPTPVALSAMVNDVAKLCSSASPDIEVDCQIDDPLPNVSGDPSQLQQLLLHLGINALKALREPGGKLTFRVERFDVDQAFIDANPELCLGPHIHVRVSDTGSGMSEDVLQHAFEPFTTSSPAEGLGLGLAVAYGVARAHSGTVLLTSQLNKGTTVDVYLPALPVDAVASGNAAIDIPMGDGERVLYVDDDTTSCLVTARLLERLGYTYQVFDNPEEALEWFAANTIQVDIALCDFSLPNTTGLDLAAELLRQRPELPVVLTTAFAGGWNSDAVRQKYGIREIVPKPLHIRTLGMALTRNLLPQALTGADDPTE